MEHSPNGAKKTQVVLAVRDLSVHYPTPDGDVIAVNHVSFDIYKGELLGLIGESGCGKTTTALAILRLLQPPGEIAGGALVLNGTTDLAHLHATQLRQVRWRDVALIPQGAMNSLNPVMRVRDQISDSIRAHESRRISNSEMRERVSKLLRLVGLPERVEQLYPHELSGGMKQRVCIAMAIALNPSLVVADEPTSALDVIVQRVVAQNLLDIKNRLGVSILLIGHDMGLMAQLADRIAVMYAGNLVEIAPARAVLKEPLHPYTQLLIEAVPSIKERKPLQVTEGLTHDLRYPPPGCIFQARCPFVMDKCRRVRPPLQVVKPNHQVACHLYNAME
ncbi:MAG TPA: ABC transporter ATP-binding protein [Anaerolineae bacterium]|nr:ABC transporter ATP-binding protein [Anaerolineae bacterium]